MNEDSSPKKVPWHDDMDRNLITLRKDIFPDVRISDSLLQSRDELTVSPLPGIDANSLENHNKSHDLGENSLRYRQKVI